jgi:GNAT acetyltransferase-like protein
LSSIGRHIFEKSAYVVVAATTAVGVGSTDFTVTWTVMARTISAAVVACTGMTTFRCEPLMPSGAPMQSAVPRIVLTSEPAAAPLMIAEANTDRPCGLINLQVRGDDEATVAYQVFPAHRGHGVAARALELVTGWAFHDLRLSRLPLEIDEANTASIRVAQKCGFVRA